MRNVFVFIRRYFNFIFFVVLQVVAVYIFFQYNKFHEAVFMGLASEVTGRVNKQYNRIEYYFQLKKTNDALVQENERLRNLLLEDFNSPDTTVQLVTDSFRLASIRRDSLEPARKYLYYSAKVINNSVSSQTNYLTINRGSAQGIVKDMSVLSPNGVVGTVVNVSKNMATVKSLLHRESRVSASLLNGGETGTVEWDGKSPQEITFRNIPKSAEVKVGDTVVTSRYSTFPPGQPIGIVQEVESQGGSNFYLLKLKPVTNFFNIQFVYAVKNLQKEEQEALEAETRKRD